ncbi:hypothetical protein L0F63_006871, partial [Massospora cicadina]
RGRVGGCDARQADGDLWHIQIMAEASHVYSLTYQLTLKQVLEASTPGGRSDEGSTLEAG